MMEGMTTETNTRDLDSALEAIHPTICPRPVTDAHSWQDCQSARRLYNGATLAAISHLRAHPRDAAAARLILHDYACMSGCQGVGAADHAKRHAGTVAALRKYLKGSGILPV